MDYSSPVGYVVHVCTFFRMWVKSVQEPAGMSNLYIDSITEFITVTAICAGSFQNDLLGCMYVKLWQLFLEKGEWD